MILAIDPGPAESAFVAWSGGKIVQMGKIANAEFFASHIQMEGVKCVAIECITGYGMQVGQEVFETCRWEGKFEMHYGLELGKTRVHRIRRRDVKSWLCENPTAKDRDVTAALLDKVGPKGTKSNPGPTFGVSGDIWAALAIALYAQDSIAQ
jgi:hypothetical protein